MKLLILTLGTLLVLAVFAFASATASTAHRDAVLAATSPWVSEVLHVPVATRTDAPGAPGQLKSGTGAVKCLDPTVALYDPPLLDAMATRGSFEFFKAWAVGLHEKLHLLGGPCVFSWDGRRDDGLDPEWLYWEEAFTESARIDLFAAYLWRMFHLRRTGWDLNFYPGRVRELRALSMVATGSSSWRDRDARAWRILGLESDWPARQALIAAARAEA